MSVWMNQATQKNGICCASLVYGTKEALQTDRLLISPHTVLNILISQAWPVVFEAKGKQRVLYFNALKIRNFSHG
jgi:hypothetical protein